ncbi:MAG: class I SAM-dependent DNA methyltransferase [Deltaproteobacteria bacterium]|jgi:SAM-dependent methyltransferase|nr:class I SAM-dependent DNA methyltransferase [Deltaproteobacteria bacterium]
MSSAVTKFITRWKASSGSEQANSKLFLTELCDALELPHPDPARPVNEENIYSFERTVSVPRGDGASAPDRLDLYRKGCFVLESRQSRDAAGKFPVSGTDVPAAVKRGARQWEESMHRAKRQVEQHIQRLPAEEGRPPFLIVADVGFCLDVYAEFTCSGGQYLHFPDARRYRIRLDELEKPEVRAMLKDVWDDPLSLDPARRAAKVTEELAAQLGELAGMLEADGHSPEKVAQFLMRCIFSMFAEDLSLIPTGGFTGILEKSFTEPEFCTHHVRDLWTAMNKGTVCSALGKKLLRFNGNIFAHVDVLPLAKPMIGILLELSKADWKETEPAILGALLERALNPKERHKLGTDYTPRAFVERLIVPAVMQPLRREWDDVQAAASLLLGQGKEKEARDEIGEFQKRLLKIRVLDPACGSGNFLYVALKHMKRLESEVLWELASFGEQPQNISQIDPRQFFGLEINPRAAQIAELVLWIGYLQWHYRTYGKVKPPLPVIKQFDNIQNKDALVAYKSWQYATDEDGMFRTRWNGESYKTDPDTGRQVPDESAVIVDKVYVAVSAAVWPKADFIVGNPPFVGGQDKARALGLGYFEALRKIYAELPEDCDYVMYWWNKAAELTRAGRAKRFGFISTSDIVQDIGRSVISRHMDDKKPLHMAFAIPEHPWVDAGDGSTVRVSVTVGAKGAGHGVLAVVAEEFETAGGGTAVALAQRRCVIHADLRQGADAAKTEVLDAQAGGKTKASRAKAKAGLPWPTEVLAQIQVVRGMADAMRQADRAVTVDVVARRFAGPPLENVREILLTLETLGLA